MAMIAVLAILATACGGGSEEAEPVPGTTGDTIADTASVESVTDGAPVAKTATATGDDRGENGDDEGEGEPERMEDFLGFSFDDPEANAAFAADMERRVQESIALCMAQEGFEYIPAVRPQDAGFFSFEQEEYARERGFGITTWFGEEGIFVAGDEEWVDPNGEIIASLSESEMDAYQEVLYGEISFGDPGPSGEVESIGDLWGGGCNGKAYEEVYGAMTAVFTELGPQLEELNQRVEADPRFREAEEIWAGCMADRGFPYDTQETMFEQVNEEFGRRLDEIVGNVDAYFDPFTGMSEEEVQQFWEERSQEEIEDFFDQARQEAMAGIDQEALAALQQEERDIAVASFECGEELNETVMEVFREYEGDFVKENRDVLERLRT
ncbi:MAG: hypothetical protein F4Z17_13050 [Acidimicrobiia bacterium]|nr:hypothetical protein [Acidimicrobiia bacterium]